MTIGERIRELRQRNRYEKKLTQKQLAEVLGVSREKIRTIESNGPCMLSPENVRTLCEYFGVDEAYLFRGEISSGKNLDPQLSHVVTVAQTNPIFRFLIDHLSTWDEKMLNGALDVITGIEIRHQQKLQSARETGSR
ncbi:helix-turn-helix domain-containing protein [Hahella ganghwensis]|uniref:helix-turn-helix domain-containing protein n=1 Tax=Hahella ganghwensis TaxID=286420 RepID=UPI0012FAD391|nr:helix-turn-helix transcriptional regulator [Hahella ganghwensis]